MTEKQAEEVIKLLKQILLELAHLHETIERKK
jgi:hypothetical protein